MKQYWKNTFWLGLIGALAIIFLSVADAKAWGTSDITNIRWESSVHHGKKFRSYEIIKAGEGEPVIGKKSFKFVAVPFDCGHDGSGWYSDCSSSGTDQNYTSNYDPNKRIGGGDRMRSELSSGGGNPLSSEVWLSFSIFIPEDYKTISPTMTSMFQIYEKGKGPNLKIEDFHGKLMAKIKIKGKEPYCACPTSENPAKPVLISIDDMKGKWTHFKVHTKQSKKEDKGFYKFYVNDKLVAEFYGKTSGNKKKGIYLKAGIYQTGISRSLPFWDMPKNWKQGQPAGNFPTQVIYMDNIFKASSIEGLNKKINKAK